jgi:hypothetical protein
VCRPRRGHSLQFLQAPSQLVACALELVQAEQRRPIRGHRGALARRLQVWEAIRHERGQLALEPGDLGSQRAPRSALT